MKKVISIGANWDENQVEILRSYNIKVNAGCDRFEIYDDKIYDELKPLFDKWNVMESFGWDFSKSEILSAKYCIIGSIRDYGYPMPDNDMTWVSNTYKSFCNKCGIHTLQIEDFRVKKVPKYPIWRLTWVPDELFVRKDLYEKVFKPLGIECRNIRNYKTNEVIDSCVQLIIPVINDTIDVSTHESQKCPHCGVTKYDAKLHGFFPLQEEPLPYIYKSKEFFGPGALAYRKIFVSALVRDLMIENKILSYKWFVPCL